MLGISRSDLSKLASVSQRTLADFESETRQPISATLDAVRRALESAGVEFIEENGGGPGVRLKKGKR